MRRRMMFRKNSELPAGYRRCEYLERVAGKSQYIKTGIIPQYDDTYIVTFSAPYGDFKYIFGADMTFQSGINIAYNSETNEGIRGVFGVAENEYTYISGIKVDKNTVYTIEMNRLNFVVTIHNYDTYRKTNSKFSNLDGIEWDIAIFTTNRNGVIQDSPIIIADALRVYKFEIVGKINLIPALDPSGIPCMYDTVTQQPFYNQGTGEFLYELSGGGIK